jgi:SAM-dependent methyltransferase
MTVETRPPGVDLTYSIHDFQAGTHRDSAFLYEAIEDAMVDLGSESRHGRVLDVACGTGKIAMRLDHRRCYAVGCEASMEMIGVGRYVHPESRASMVRSIAETLPFADASFDRVLCQGSLDHFADAHAFMRESARILKPDGRVVIALANFESLSCKLGRGVDRIKRRLGRPRPPWRPYWIIPEDHNVKGDMAFVRALGGDFLELDRIRGISLLWLFSRYGQVLDVLPRPAARALWGSLDRFARIRPEMSDMIISVWRKPGSERASSLVR